MMIGDHDHPLVRLYDLLCIGSFPENMNITSGSLIKAENNSTRLKLHYVKNDL